MSVILHSHIEEFTMDKLLTMAEWRNSAVVSTGLLQLPVA